MKKQQGMVSAMRWMRWNQAVLGFVAMVGGGAGCQIVLGMGDWVDVGSGTGGSGGTTGSGGVAGMTGGTGGMTVTACEPGAKVACYDGPPGTEGKGNCKGGMATCNEDGMSLGPCEGQVLPGAEVPEVIGDEACDGYALGEPVWWSAFGGDGVQYATSIATDAAGNTYICGAFDGVIQFGDLAAFAPAGFLRDVFLVKLDPDGKPLWAKQFGDQNTQDNCEVALGDDGRITIAGRWKGAFALGGDVIDSAGTEDVFVAQFDTDGAHLWSKKLGYVPNLHLGNVLVHSSGDAVVVGYGLDPNPPQSTAEQSFYARLHATDGHEVWKVIAPFGATLTQDLDTGPNDTLIVFEVIANAQFQDTDSLNRLTLTAGGQGSDGAVDYPYYDMAGTPCAIPTGLGISVDALGNSFLTANSECPVHLGALELPAGVTLLAKTKPDGTVPWQKVFGAEVNSMSRPATDPAGNVVAAVTTSTQVDFGSGLVGPQSGAGSVVVGKLNPNGQAIWARSFVGADQTQPVVTTTKQAEVVLADSFATSVTVETVPITSKGKTDLLVVKLAP